MHSTTLTPSIRQHYVEPAFGSSAVRMHPDRAAERAMQTMMPRKRKSEVRCPECQMILGKQATSCFC